MARRPLIALAALLVALAVGTTAASADTTHVFQKYITLAGTGGGSGASEIGLYSSAAITAGTGSISLTGTASAAANGDGSHGVFLDAGNTTGTSGSGTVTIAGTANRLGTSMGPRRRGLRSTDAGVVGLIAPLAAGIAAACRWRSWAGRSRR